MRLFGGLALAGVVAGLATAASAAPIVLYNTGVDNAGVALADNATDPHYVLATNPDATGLNAIVQNSGAFPIVAGPWLANTAASKWIGPRFDTTNSAGGVYGYNMTFTLPAGAAPSTATITGNWAFDDGEANLDRVLLNGVQISPVGNAGFSSYTAFTIPAGSNFLPGANVLRFEGNNGGGYTGLRVDGISGTVTTPEPGSLALVGVGLAGLAGRRRRR